MSNKINDCFRFLFLFIPIILLLSSCVQKTPDAATSQTDQSSFLDSTINVSSSSVTTYSSIDLTLSLNTDLLSSGITPPRVEFLIYDGISDGEIGPIQNLGNGKYKASFTARTSKTPVRFTAKINGEYINTPSPPLTVYKAVGVSISDATSGYVTASNQNNFILRGSCSENGKLVTVSGTASGSTYCQNGSFSKALNLSSLGEGKFSISVTHQDDSLHTAYATKNFVKDTGPPTVLIIQKPNIISGKVSADFTFTAQESDVSSFECSLGSANFSKCTSPFILTPITQGVLTFRIRAIDIAGNIGTPTSYSWTNDLTGPTVTVVSRPALLTNLTTATFDWSAVDSGGGNVLGYECSINGGQYSLCAPPKTYTSLPIGNRNFSIRAYDSLGNRGSTVSYTWTIDQTAPVVTFGSVPATVTNSTSISLSFTGADSGGGSISGYECRLDTASFTSCSSPVSYSGLSQAAHSIEVRATDSSGNTGSAASFNWIVDLTPPSVSLSVTPSSLTNSLSATFSFIALDSGGGVVANSFCSLNGGAFTLCTSPVQYSSLTAGVQNFSIKAMDSAGNMGPTTSYAWSIDTTAPTVTFVQTPPATSYLSTANFSWTSNDSGGGTVSGYECKLDSSVYSSCTSPQALSSLSNASHTLYVRATDSAGNTSSAVTHTWTVDTNSNLVSITSSPPPVTNQTSVSFGFSAGPGAASFECKFNSSAYSACTNPRALTGLSAGTHVFKVRPLDSNSNIGPEVSYQFLVDLVAPTLSVGNQPPATTNSTSATFVFAATDTGGGAIANFECRVDAGSFSVCSSPLALSGLAQGSHSLDIRVSDTAGNQSTTTTISWVIDTTAPTVTISSSPNSITNSSSASFSFTATDSGGGTIDHYECSLDSASFTVCTSPTALSSLTSGNHTFSVKAVDTAGNIGGQTTYSWTIDQLVPTLTLSSTPALITNSTAASFTFSSSDTGGGSVAANECKIDAGTYASCTTPKSYTGLAQGSHTFYARAVDTAGNTSVEVSYTWTIDTTPPTVTITTPATNGTIIPASQISNYTVSGACSENGMPINLSGSVTASTTCSSNSWSASLNYSAIADGSISLSASQTDSALNTFTTTAMTLIKDTTLPTLTLTTVSAMQGNTTTASYSWSLTEANIATSTNFSIELYNGSTWSTVGTKAATSGSNNNASYTLSPFTLPNVDTASAKFRVSITDAAGNTRQSVTSDFILQSSLPVVNSFSITQGATTSLQNIQLNFASTSVLTNITEFCIKLTSTKPISSDSCWRSINANPPGVSPGLSVSVSGYYYQLGFTTGAYTIYAFTKNSLGQISSLSNSSAGTAGTDMASIFYTSPTPPAVSNIVTANSDIPSSPVNASDYIVGSGGNVYIKWKATDSVGLSTNPITLEYTTDGISYAQIATNVANQANSGCTADSSSTTLDDGNTGCYVWSGGAPSSYFAVRVRAKNSSQLSASAQGNFINSGSIKVVAGNVDSGINGSANAAVIRIKKSTATPFTQQFAVLPDGKIIVIDSSFGITMVDPSTGVYSILIPNGGTTNTQGDGGAISGAKVKNPIQLTIDHSGNIYIWDDNRIRKITTSTNPWTINTIIGGGASVTGTNIAATSLSLGTTRSYLSARPNGTIWFIPNNPTSTFNSATPPNVYVYTASDGYVNKVGTFGGTGDTSSSTRDLTAAQFYHGGLIAFSYNQVTSASEAALGCVSLSSSCQTTRFNTSTLLADPNDANATPYGSYLNPQIATITGLDGKIYMINSGGNLYRWNNVSAPSVIAGSGTGNCIDTTTATSCKMNINDAFVDSNGKVYFIDSGLIRTIDSSNKIVTLAGQNPAYGDGLKGSEARFGTIKSVSTNSTGDVTILDSDSLRIRKWNRSSNLMSLLAGNGSNGIPNTTSLANAQQIALDIWTDTATIDTLPTSGEVLYNRGNNISKIDSSTGKWVDLAGGGSTPYPSADGMTLGSIQLKVAYYPKVLGATDSSVVAVLTSYDLNFKDNMLKTFNLSNGTQSHFAGAAGVNANSALPADGSTLATSLMPYNGAFSSMVYDSTAGSWYMVDASPTNKIKSLTPGGTVSTLFTDTSATTIRAVTASRSSGSLIVYYCANVGTNYQLKKWNQSTSTITALSWPSTSISCLANTLDFNPVNGNLVFAFTLGGLSGVAEFTSP